jgi:hypothetical protein
LTFAPMERLKRPPSLAGTQTLLTVRIANGCGVGARRTLVIVHVAWSPGATSAPPSAAQSPP